MKAIGVLHTGNYLVEMSDSEHREFLIAARAANGLTFAESAERGEGWKEGIDGDTKQFFWALHKFIIMKFEVNELKKAVDRLQETLAVEKLGEHQG